MTALRRHGSYLALGLAILAVSEGLSHLALRLSRPLLDEEVLTTEAILADQSQRIGTLLTSDTTGLLILDSALGWRYRAGYADSRTEVNAQGLRSARNYARRTPSGRVRVAAFGDSFVYGSEVRTGDAWPTLMERVFPQLEVLNYGVGGYGVDQAYLRFRAEGVVLRPRVVLIGFVSDDLRRVVNVYRRFLSHSEIPLTKPRFVLAANDELRLLENPLATAVRYQRYLHSPRTIVELGVNDQWYRPEIYENPLYDRSATVRLAVAVWVRIHDRYLARDRLVRHGVFSRTSRAYKIQMALLRAFAQEARTGGALPLVVFFPDKSSLTRARRGLRSPFSPLMADVAAAGIDHVDLTPAFMAAAGGGGMGHLFMPGGHYSPAGNRVVAASLGRDLVARHAAGELALGPRRVRAVAASARRFADTFAERPADHPAMAVW